METQASNPNALITADEIYNRSIETFRDGGAILLANQALVSKIVAAGQSILNQVQANGGKLNPELDKLCNAFIAKANTRKKEIEETRKPVTQMMTAVQKMFTAEESKIDVTKPDTEIGIIQGLRNQYAKELAEEEKKRKDEADKKAKKAQEAIKLKSDCETQLTQYFNDYLLQTKQTLQSRFNAMTLADFDTIADKLKEYNPIYAYKHYESFVPRLYAMNHDQKEVQNVVTNVVNGRFDTFSEKYKAELTELKNSLIVRLPSKKSELNALAEADQEEKDRLEADKKKREEEADRKLKEEALQSQQQAEFSINSSAAAEETMVLFEKEAAVTVDTPAPETRQGFEIEVTGKPGYVQIFQLWYENEGKGLDVEKIEKKTVGAMKKFCETLAHKKDIKIESPFINYKPSYKAVNRTTKD
ncbi:MAG: hypothetical protein WC756_12020 [Taibaiella sp.]|jgi:hypothetical protein